MVAQEDPQLWHVRFGYLDYAPFRPKWRMSFLISMSSMPHIVCVHGKHHCELFPCQASHYDTSILELVNMDSFHRMCHTTLQEERYFMLITDDSPCKASVLLTVKN